MCGRRSGLELLEGSDNGMFEGQGGSALGEGKRVMSHCEAGAGEKIELWSAEVLFQSMSGWW